MKLKLTGQDGQSREFVESAGTIKIGRSHENDFQILRGNISRSHCSIAINEKGAHLKDNGSKYGTSVKGVEIKEDIRKTLENGDKIILSPKSKKLPPYTITVEIEDAPIPLKD